MARLGRLTWLIVLLSGVWLAAPAAALDPRLSIGQLKHTRWTVEDGAPPDIIAIAQSKDGFLWLGAGNGLYRFDGISFEAIPAIAGDRTRSAQITALFFDRSGALWVGYRRGGLAVYRNGRWLPLALPDVARPVIGFAQTPDGAVWVLSSRLNKPITRYKDGKWTAIDSSWGMPDQIVSSIATTRDGSLWAVGWKGISRLARDARHFEHVKDGEDLETGEHNRALSLDRSGRLWMLSADGLRLVFDGRNFVPAAEGAFSNFTMPARYLPRLVADRDGGFWASPQQGGITRLSLPGDASHRFEQRDLEPFGMKEGLSADNASALFEGRSGEIWVGTASGLDRFRSTSVIPMPTLAMEGGLATLALADGNLYLESRDALYIVPRGGSAERLVAGVGYIGAACAAPDGSVKLLINGELLTVRRGSIDRTTAPAELANRAKECLFDGAGRLLVAGADAGIWSYAGNKWVRLPIAGINFNNNWATTIQSGPNGRIFVTLGGLGLYELTGEHLKPIWDAAQIGSISAIDSLDGQLVMGGRFGLARYDGKKISVISADEQPYLAGANSLTHTATDLWMFTDRGLVRIPHTMLFAAFDHRAKAQPRLYGLLDGLPAVLFDPNSHSIAAGADGRVWMSAPGGVALFDGSRPDLPREAVQPVILSLATEGRSYDADAGPVRLAQGTSRFSIAFTAPALQRPDLVRFRYRLSGVDANWVDAGSTRTAAYTNLGPGDYRFDLSSSNGAGWTPSVSMAIKIPPTFVQSIWFKLVIALLIAGLIWFAYIFRLRRVTDRVRASLEARLAERERIARELHDTLLQGFHGLIYRFQSIADRIGDNEPVKPLINQALDQADAVLVEGRESVGRLRGRGSPCDLAEALTETAREAPTERAAQFNLTVEGQAVALHPAAHDEVLRIAQEAIRNAFRHAEAKSISASLIYLPGELRFGLSDDGIGIPETVAKDGERAGHFGLVGMRERASRIGGTLTISSRAGSGTEITLSVPGRTAYFSVRKRWLDWVSGRVAGIDDG